MDSTKNPGLWEEAYFLDEGRSLPEKSISLGGLLVDFSTSRPGNKYMKNILIPQAVWG